MFSETRKRKQFFWIFKTQMILLFSLNTINIAQRVSYLDKTYHAEEIKVVCGISFSDSTDNRHGARLCILMDL